MWEVGQSIAEAEEREREAVFKHGAHLPAGTIPAEVLYGESDGVWIHLQGEHKRSAEVRVGIMYTGKRMIGVGRYALNNKVCVTKIVKNSQEWQEMLLKVAHSNYDLANTKQLIIGGDGNRWVRQSFDRFDIQQEFILDRFHLFRAGKRCIGYQKKATDIVKRLCREGLEPVEEVLFEIGRYSNGKRRKKLEDFIKYLRNNQDALMDYDLRPRDNQELGKVWNLGAIEGNVDKLVVQRLKGRGRSWRLAGVKAMLALCRHKDSLQKKALHFEDLRSIQPVLSRRKVRRTRDDGVWLQAGVPSLHGRDEGKPWVQNLKHSIHGKPVLSLG